MALDVAVVVLGYLVGTIPTALLVGRRRGIDPTRAGSGNPGASNVYRTMGARAGAVVFAGDLLKGAVAAGLGWAAGDRVLALVAGGMAVFGHIAPVTRRFRGGKGVATAGGVLVVLFPVVALPALLVWVLVARVAGKASLASVLAVLLAAALVAALGPPAEELVRVAAIAGLVVVRHAENIRRLLRGQERSLR